MKKILLFLFATNLYATQWRWDGGGADNNWSTANNWTADASYPQSTADSVVLDSGADTCVVNGSGTIARLQITNGFTGSFSMAGVSLVLVAGGFHDDGTGTRNYGTGITISGVSDTLHIGNIGASTATSTVLTFNGTTGCRFDDDEGVTWKSIVLGVSAVVTNAGSGSTQFSAGSGGTPLTLGNNSTFTSNAAIQYNTVGTCNLWSIGSGVTLNGSGQHYVNPGSATVSIPAVTHTGTGSFDFVGSANCSITLTGNFIWNGNVAIRSSATTTFSTGNYNLVSKSLRLGSSGAGGVFTFNAGSSTITCSDWSGSTYNTGTTNINLQTSKITCTGAWTYGTNHIVTVGTSRVVICPTLAAINVTSNGKWFYDWCDSAVNTFKITLADSLRDSSSCFIKGKLDQNGKSIYTLLDYQNVAATTDTVWRKGNLFIGRDFYIASTATRIFDTTNNVFCNNGGAYSHQSNSNGQVLNKWYLRDSRARPLTLNDNHVWNRFILDSGTLLQNKKTIIDSVHTILDSLCTDTTITVYTRDSIGSNARLCYGANTSKQWIGTPVCSVWTNGKTRMRSTMNKTGAGKIVFADPVRISNLTLTDGAFYSGDTIYVSDTMSVNTMDSCTFKIIRLTTNRASLTFGSGIHTGFISGAKIIADSCGAVVTNTWGGSLPTLTYPTVGPISYDSTIAIYNKGVVIDTLMVTNSGCAADSFVVSPALPTGLSIDATTGVITGTPTTASAATNYIFTAYNNGGTSTALDTITITVLASTSGRRTILLPWALPNSKF